MSRNRHERSYQKEKLKKKSRTQRLKYEKERNDSEEGAIKRSVWSRWMNFIREHWCGQVKKAPNSLDACTGALSTDVFDIAIEPKSSTSRKKVTFENCGDGFIPLDTKSYFMDEKDKNICEKEDFLRWGQTSEGHQTGRDVLLTSNLCFGENMDKMLQNNNFRVPDLWNYCGESRNLNHSNAKFLHANLRRNPVSERSFEDITKSISEPTWSEKAKIYHKRQVQADINSLLDQLMCIQQDFYTMQHRETKVKKKVSFGVESTTVSQKKPLQHKISRQVSPEVLVNIKPFKRQIKKNFVENNFSFSSAGTEFNINQIEELEEPEMEVNLEQEPSEKKIDNFQNLSPVLSPVLTSQDICSTPEQKPILPQEVVNFTVQSQVEEQTNEEVVGSTTLRKDFCFVVGVYRSYNEVCGESRRSALDEVLDSFDDSDHDKVFKKNIEQFRKKIPCTSTEEYTEKIAGREQKQKKGVWRKIRMEQLAIEKVMGVYKKSQAMLGVRYNFVEPYNITKGIRFTRRKIHTTTILHRARKIDQFHESNFHTLVLKRFPNETTLVVRETRPIRLEDLRTKRIFRELKYCLKDGEGVAKVLVSPNKKSSKVYFMTYDCSKLKQPEPVKSQENIIDLLSFMQEYSSLVERNYACEEFIEIEKILSSVAKSFSSLALSESESETEVFPEFNKITVENIAMDCKAVQILNGSAQEYAAFIYEKPTSRSYTENSSSEPDLYKKARQVITNHSDTCLLEDLWIRRRSFKSAFDVDSLRIFFDGVESDEDDETAIMKMIKHCELGVDQKFNRKKKNSTFITCMGETKMLTCNSFPGGIAARKSYRVQRSFDMFRDLYKDFRKKRKPVEKWLDIKKMINSLHLESEKLIKGEKQSGKTIKPLPLKEQKNFKGNSSKKMFFIEKNTKKFTKEVIAAFSVIKDLSEEKNGSKMSVVILLCKK